MKNLDLKKVVSAILPKAHAYTHSIRTDPLQQFMFTVQIGNTIMGFQKVSGLNADLNVVEYHEGCTNYPIKLAGKATFGEVTLEKGLVPYSDDAVTLLDGLSQVAGDGTMRDDITICVLDRRGRVKAKYKLHDAFISKWEAPDLDASSDDIAIEKATIQYDYFTYVKNPRGTSSATNWTPQETETSENSDTEETEETSSSVWG